MTPIELLRYRVLSARRAARRPLARIKTIEDPDSLSAENRREMESNIALFQTALAATRPAWVKQASVEELMQFICHLTGEQKN